MYMRSSELLLRRMPMVVFVSLITLLGAMALPSVVRIFIRGCPPLPPGRWRTCWRFPVRLRRGTSPTITWWKGLMAPPLRAAEC